ncbi:MAG: hypothetical protein ACI8RZ_003507 [Myxococcota bacterium]|jgi:hypothetical protein
MFSLSLLSLALAAPPTTQDALESWWLAAGQIYLGDTVYRIADKPVVLADSVCEFTLTSGAMIPVYSGVAPVSERMIGLVWLGEGASEVSFNDRGDVLAFANHMVINADADPEEFRSLLDGDPLSSQVDRGLVLSADPALLSLFEGLEPIGGGALITAGINGSDETYIITESDGEGRLKRQATNLLVNRLNELKRSGMDPRVMLRQDRLLGEELGHDGAVLRVLADFRTDRNFRVAGLEDTLGADNYDRWLTCSRDGMDTENTGYRAMAFAHGTDLDQRRHFMRISGERSEPAGTPERPAFTPVRADVAVDITPRLRGLEQEGVVTTQLTLRAEGGPLQYAALDMPVGSAILGSWSLDSLTTADGQAIPWVGLSAGVTGLTGETMSSDVQGVANESTIAAGTSGTLSSGGINISGTQGSGGATTPTANSTDLSLGANGENSALSESIAFGITPYRYQVMVLLPRAVPAGEEVTLNLTWSARWKFANFAVSERFYANDPDQLAEPRSIYRPLGATTSAQPLLPGLMPAAGAGTWDFTAALTTPQPLFVSRTAVLSGQTTARQTDPGTGSLRITTQGEGSAGPAFALGRWIEQQDVAAEGMPAIGVALAPKQNKALPTVSPEIRRVVSFLEGRLPDFPRDELEVYQDMEVPPLVALQQDYLPAHDGLIGLRTVSSPTVTSGGMVRDLRPHEARIQLARQVAGQYWGQQIVAASSRDQWLVDALSGAYAAFYLRSSVGVEAYQEHMEAIRSRLESPREFSAAQGAPAVWKRTDATRLLSPTAAPSHTDIPAGIRADYGAYVLAGMLRPRLGDDVFFAALDHFAAINAGKAVTTEDLQTAFELTAGQDLSAFFDTWIHSGAIPALSLAYRVEGSGAIRGCIDSSVALGTLDTQLWVSDDSGIVEAMVQVVDGVGRFEVGPRVGEVTVALDPEAITLATSRTVWESDALACWDDALVGE